MMLLRFFITVYLLINTTVLLAETEAEQQLHAVQTEIDTLSQDVERNKASKATLYAQLKQQSRQVSKLNKELLALKKKLAGQNKKLAVLLQQVEQQNNAHAEQLAALLQQINTAFINGQPSFIKVLLNQQDPASLSRNKQYFHYFNQARTQQLEHIVNTLNNLSDAQKTLYAAQKKQQQLYDLQQKKQSTLTRQAKKRRQTLALLDTKINQQGSRLSQLNEQEGNLQQLIQSLNNAPSATVIVNSDPHSPFAKRKGLLSWPLSGKVFAPYGSSRNVGKLTWQGILIASPSGNNIAASAPGKIVFSDWLRGFGLLIIIDHGDQYMTLYANNETLLKQVGDNVITGELIAQSGDKGIQQHAGLYFEIRHKGSPINPSKWLGRQS